MARTLDVLCFGERAGVARAERELLLLQSSDWAFQVCRDLAGEYPRDRAAGHREALEQAIAATSYHSL